MTANSDEHTKNYHFYGEWHHVFSHNRQKLQRANVRHLQDTDQQRDQVIGWLVTTAERSAAKDVHSSKSRLPMNACVQHQCLKSKSQVCNNLSHVKEGANYKQNSSPYNNVIC